MGRAKAFVAFARFVFFRVISTIQKTPLGGVMLCKIFQWCLSWRQSAALRQKRDTRRTQLCKGLCASAALLLVLLPCPTLRAQSNRTLPHVNYLLSADQPPGYVASAQVARGMPGVGTFQPLQISGPEGLSVALAQDGFFLENLEAPVTTAMMVGATYRFRVANIPFRPGVELYPSVEVIDRVYAPIGREHRFPIPVVLTTEDLNAAIHGALVTRVIYLEDSEVATPVAAEPGIQTVLDVTATENALQMADQLGRPVAILRIGSRVPSNLHGDLTGFLYGCPPWLPVIAVPEREALVRDGGWPNTPPVIAADEIYSQTPAADSPRLPDAR